MRCLESLSARIGLAIGALFGSLFSMVSIAAAQSAFDPLTAAVDFAEVLAAIIAIAALVAGVQVLWRGVKFIYRALNA